MSVRPAQDEVAWWSGLRWVDAARMQAQRFEDAFFEEIHALADARMRQELSDDSENSRSWRESLDAHHLQFDPQRPARVPSTALHMQVATELDLFSVAVRNVLRAQARIPQPQRPALTGQDVLELMRNVSEHWDEVGGRSASSLAADHPDIEVDGIAYTNKELWIGGLHGVPVSRIRAWLEEVWIALVAVLAEAGVDVPDDLLASRVEGDEELGWPPERLRHHWSIPLVEERDWPRESIPAELDGYRPIRPD